MTLAQQENLDGKVAAFVKKMEDSYADLAGQYDLAWWEMATTGTPQAVGEWERLALATRRVFADQGEFEQLRGWFEQRASLNDPVLRRQLEILYASFLEAQQDPTLAEEQARLEAQVESMYNNYRGTFQGKKLTDNELTKVLQTSRASQEVREAYLAGKEVGAEVATTVLKLAEMRNVSARRLGYRDHYAKALAAQELDEAELFGVMEQLAAATEAPFRQAKAKLDERLITRFGLKTAAELRPWHYADPFFQRPPEDEHSPMEGLFRDGKEIEELTVKTYDGLGLDIRDVVARSDLYERSGKSQHAFCQKIDRRTDDVRVLCNLEPNARWMETNLHEFGHAVYDKYLDHELPYWLRTVAHISTTEAIAMLMGRLATNQDWLSKIKGLSAEEISGRVGALNEVQRLSLLVFMRWGLVMVYFERDMYANPSRPDLNKLWWDYVERFQLLTRPDDREAPDWAAKLHLATAPAYYQNYLLGELIASQLQAYLTREVAGHSLVQNRAAGDYLLRLFHLGARYNWNDTMRQVTGEPLTPAYFVQQAVG